MALWTPTQKVTTKKLKDEGCERVYRVEVPEPRFQEAIHNAFLRVQLKARIAGFRPGKAPMDMIQRQYADGARAQAADDVIRAVVPEVLKELKLHLVSTPTVGDIESEDGKPLSFELRVEVTPEFQPKGYKGLSVTRRTYAVKDADLEARLVQLQEGNARLEKSPAEAVDKNHYVVIDYEISRDGNSVPNALGKQELVDMSSEQIIEGLSAGLLGAKRTETREFPIQFNGQSAQCKATVMEIKDKILPKLDDEFAKDLSFDTLDALRAKLREILESEAKEKSDTEFAMAMEKALLTANPIPIPHTLAEHQLEHTLERVQQRYVGAKRTLSEAELEKLRKELRPRADDQLRVQFIVSRIAQEEKIEVTDEELQQELNKNLEKAETPEHKQSVHKLFTESSDDIRAALRERKVWAFMRDAAKIQEEKV